MVIHHNWLSILKKIDEYFTLKPSSIGKPDIYLGAKLSKMAIPNGVWFWSMIPFNYVQESVRNFKTHLKEKWGGKYYLVKDADNHFSYHYEPKVGVYEPIDPAMASYYQYLIEIMRWMVE